MERLTTKQAIVAKQSAIEYNSKIPSISHNQKSEPTTPL
jgi:hypothetical protein